MKRKSRAEVLRKLARAQRRVDVRRDAQINARVTTSDGTEMAVTVGAGAIVWLDVAGKMVSLDALDVKRLASLLIAADTVLERDQSAELRPAPTRKLRRA